MEALGVVGTDECQWEAVAVCRDDVKGNDVVVERFLSGRSLSDDLMDVLSQYAVGC